MPSQSDQPLIMWVRLFDGRLWHAAADLPIRTKYGININRPPEHTPTPPANGWICDRCVRHLHEMAAAAQQAWLQDPRRRPGDQLPAPDPDSPPEPEIELCTSTIQPDGDEVRCGLPSAHVEFHTDKGLRYHWADNTGHEDRADVTAAAKDEVGA